MYEPVSGKKEICGMEAYPMKNNENLHYILNEKMLECINQSE